MDWILLGTLHLWLVYQQGIYFYIRYLAASSLHKEVTKTGYKKDQFVSIHRLNALLLKRIFLILQA